MRRMESWGGDEWSREGEGGREREREKGKARRRRESKSKYEGVEWERSPGFSQGRENDSP